MGHKVDMSEVISLSSDVNSATDCIESSLEAIHSNINLFEQMTSFKGKTADAAKQYFTDLHITLLDTFNELFVSLESQLSSHIAIFQSDVDSSESARIERDYLTENEEKIFAQYQEIYDSVDRVNGSIRNIADISNVNAQNISPLTDQYSSLTKDIQSVNEQLVSFTSVGKEDHSNVKTILNEIETIMQHLGKLTVKDRFSTYYSNGGNPAVLDLKKQISQISKTRTVVKGAITSYAMFMAGKKAGLRAEVVVVNGKKYYRILATEQALKHLGITPDKEAEKALNKLLPKNGRRLSEKQMIIKESNTAILKYNSKKPGQSGWSKTGEDVLTKHAALEYWNDKATVTDKAKNVGKAALKGGGDSLKNAVDVKSVVKSGSVVKGAGKALGPIGAGLSYYSNYHEATAEGLNVKEAAKRATIDTTIDTAVGGAIQAGFTAAGTAFIPIPGVGTAIGIAAGIFVNGLINKRSTDKYGNTKKDSIVDKIKGWFH